MYKGWDVLCKIYGSDKELCGLQWATWTGQCWDAATMLRASPALSACQPSTIGASSGTGSTPGTSWSTKGSPDQGLFSWREESTWRQAASSRRLSSRSWRRRKTSSTPGSSTRDVCSASLSSSWTRSSGNFTGWKTGSAGRTWQCLLKTAKRSASPNAVSLWISISGGSISPPSLVFVVQPWAFPILVWKEWPSQLGLTASFSSFSSLHCQGCTSLFCAFPGGESLPHRADHWPPGQDTVPQCCFYKGPIHHSITSPDLQMLSSVTINCQVTKIVMNPGSQLSVL